MAFYLTYILAFYLAYLLTFFLAYCLRVRYGSAHYDQELAVEVWEEEEEEEEERRAAECSYKF